MSAADDLLFAPIGAKTDIKVPDAWVEILGSIQSRDGFHDASLAGGALRDIDNGRPVKDVDIFIPSLGNPYAYITLLAARLPGQTMVQEIEHNVHSTSQVGREGISHFHFEYQGWKFEVSQKTDAFDYRTLLDSFDLGICMISLDQNNQIYRTPEYKKDVLDHTISVIRLTGGREMDHAFRIKKKYTGWNIIPL